MRAIQCRGRHRLRVFEKPWAGRFATVRILTIVVSLGVGAWATGCSGASAPDPARIDARVLADLQGQLATGNAPAWYSEKLDELGYYITAVRYGDADRLLYRVERDERAYQVSIQLDPETETGTQIEISPMGVATASAQPAADSGAPTGTAAGPPTPSQGAAADPAAAGTSEPSASRADPAAAPEPSPATASEPSAAQQPPSPSTPATAAEPAGSTAPASRPPRVVTVPSGTRIRARLNDFLDSGASRAGDRFTMTVSESVHVAGITTIPTGTLIHGVVEAAESARRPNKGGSLVLKAEGIGSGAERVDFEGIVTAETQELQGRDSTREDLKEIAIGAGIGGVLGGLLGGGKGVLAGILIGGGGTFAATKGEQVELPPDTPLIVELREPVEIPVR